MAEIARGHSEGLWDTAQKSCIGEEELNFNLLVISNRVSVKAGVSADSKRLSRLEIGCSVDASRRVANEDSGDKVRYCLEEDRRGEKGSRGGGGAQGAEEKWVSAAHAIVGSPAHRVVDVVSVEQRRVTLRATKESSNASAGGVGDASMSSLS